MSGGFWSGRAACWPYFRAIRTRIHHQLVGGIHYCVIRAVVDGSGRDENGYAVVDVYDDGSLRIEGFRKQVDYEWAVV